MHQPCAGTRQRTTAVKPASCCVTAWPLLPKGEAMTLSARDSCHLALIGGAPLDGPRRINWNFVASDPELIESARQRWATGDWPEIPGEWERIVLPG